MRVIIDIECGNKSCFPCDYMKDRFGEDGVFGECALFQEDLKEYVGDASLMESSWYKIEGDAERCDTCVQRSLGDY